jgi:hypothetical protein
MFVGDLIFCKIYCISDYAIVLVTKVCKEGDGRGCCEGIIIDAEGPYSPENGEHNRNIPWYVRLHDIKEILVEA